MNGRNDRQTAPHPSIEVSNVSSCVLSLPGTPCASLPLKILQSLYVNRLKLGNASGLSNRSTSASDSNLIASSVRMPREGRRKVDGRGDRRRRRRVREVSSARLRIETSVHELNERRALGKGSTHCVDSAAIPDQTPLCHCTPTETPLPPSQLPKSPLQASDPPH